jgi:enoyl-CoA hydratase/carnithine racemase
MYETLIVETTGPIVKITLNRPNTLNALNPMLLRELGDVLGEIAGNEAVNAVILTGAGRAFCAGVDIKSMDESGEESSAEGRTKLALKIIDTVENMTTPVIAAVNGFCLTGGLELAIACDIIVASETAKFGDTHAKWGLTPIWGGSQRLPRIVGAMKAKELVFTGDIISADEARKIGLANNVVAPEKLDEAVMEMAKKICDNSPYSVRAQKSLINKGLMMNLADGLKMAEVEAPGPTEDSEERLKRFTSKKKS